MRIYTYISLNILVISTTEYFYKLFHILPSPQGKSKYQQQVQILSNTTNPKHLISDLLSNFFISCAFLIRLKNAKQKEKCSTNSQPVKQVFTVQSNQLSKHHLIFVMVSKIFVLYLIQLDNQTYQEEVVNTKFS